MDQLNNIKTATIAMGCFWSPDGLYGCTQGVLRTRVGYSGGTTENPTYRSIGDHTESIEIDFDPSEITYKDLLKIFWENHTPIYEPYKQQYKSILFYRNEDQLKLNLESKEKAEVRLKKKTYTEIIPYTQFNLAEDYHQKYKLQRNTELMRCFTRLYPDKNDFINSTLAARVNGYVSNKCSLRVVQQAMSEFGSSNEIILEIENILKDFKMTDGISC